MSGRLSSRTKGRKGAPAKSMRELSLEVDIKSLKKTVNDLITEHGILWDLYEATDETLCQYRMGVFDVLSKGPDRVRRVHAFRAGPEARMNGSLDRASDAYDAAIAALRGAAAPAAAAAAAARPHPPSN